MTSSASVPITRQGPSWVSVVLWFALTLALVVGAPALPWQRAFEQMKVVETKWIAAAVLANLLVLPLWAAEWRLLVPGAIRVAYGRMFEVVAVTAAVLNSVPLFAGEASAVALLIARAGLSRGAALSVLAMDQLLVGFAKLTVLASAALVAPLPGWLRTGVLSLVLLVLAMLVVLLPLAHGWTSIRDRLLARRSSIRVGAARLVEWGAHFDVLREGRRAWRVALLALAKKAAELVGILAVQMAFGIEPSIAAALLLLGALAITTLLPVAPANLGVYEATVFATYRFLGVPAEAALGLAIVQHLCVLLPSLATGYCILTLRQLPQLPPKRPSAS
ncbi:MAG: lysylphosphatidylglycerol synthase transmembrane domain-containing protein [Gemmatimonadaceae bacterium]